MLASLPVSHEGVCVCVCVYVKMSLLLFYFLSLLLNRLYFISWQDSKMRTFEGNQDLHCGKESDAEKISLRQLRKPSQSTSLHFASYIVTRQVPQIHSHQQVICQGVECLLIIEGYI